MKIYSSILDEDIATEVQTKNFDSNRTNDSTVTRNMRMTSESPLESGASLKGMNDTERGNNGNNI